MFLGQDFFQGGGGKTISRGTKAKICQIFIFNAFLTHFFPNFSQEEKTKKSHKKYSHWLKYIDFQNLGGEAIAAPSPNAHVFRAFIALNKSKSNEKNVDSQSPPWKKHRDALND